MKKEFFVIPSILILILVQIQFSLSLPDYSLKYDSNGNLLGGFGENYSYNGFNQLDNATNGNTGELISKYFYDSEGNRIKKISYGSNGLNETTYYIDQNFIQVSNSSGVYNETYYYDKSDLVAKKDNNGKVFFYHPDQLGSTNLVTNQSGDIVEETFYLPYGEVLSGGNDRYLFTGKEKDVETGLQYYGARYYDPYFSHFTQPDSLLPDIYDPQQLNRYSYARNNPYSYTDPSGNIPLDVVFDVAFIGFGIHNLVNDPSLRNLGGLGLDIGFSVVPFVPNFKRIAEFGEALDKVDDTVDLVKSSEKTIDKITNVEKTSDSGSLDLKSFTKGNFRENVLKQTRELGVGKEAHHNLPQAKDLAAQFEKAGINIHDPKFGSLVEKTQHRQTAYKFNQEFKSFFSKNINPTKEQIINRARDISNKFGFNSRF